MSIGNLPEISERIRATFIAKNAARDKAVNLSRELIRYCSLTIRASHRDEWEEAERLLGEARRVAMELKNAVGPYPDLIYTGYTQDALKELAEAHVTLAVARGTTAPTPEEIGVEYAAYLNGLAEAAGELRRRALDKIRGGHSAESERLLRAMDDIYDVLVTMDFPDAITGGLRRNTDMVRGVLERTRGDLTVSSREAELKTAIDALSARLDQPMPTESPIRHLSQRELEAGLDYIRHSPKASGRLDGIVIRPTTDERATLRACEVSPAGGVHGDRWVALGKSADVQVTLMNSRAAQLFAQSPERWPLAGDQLYVDLDLNESNLPPGTQVAIGTALFEITEKPHNGCAKFAARFGADALAFVNSPEGKRQHLRGIYAKVLVAGTIRVGDAVRKIDAGEPL